MGIKIVGLEQDHDGLIPESLESSIKNIIEKGERIPKYLYSHSILFFSALIFKDIIRYSNGAQSDWKHFNF